ncbi:cache domain-containing sensor histidine kinase [Paenibacillus luteus]|uniref:cache domain-containing sensor histidine kinase n=1 Tax=Paenibacillus luteus TaxID=2545753 RepID=UPI0011448DA3|nr:sensor histidine kinase [Paenibacillus luteus]
MRKWFQYVVPHKLKYRLFVAFALLILLPFGILNVYNFQRIESVIQEKISDQSHEQLKNLQRTLQDQMSIAFKALIFLEQDAVVRNLLKAPETGNLLDNKDVMEEKFKGINNSFFLYNPSVYFTLLDLQGNVYTSYQPKTTLNYESMRQSRWFEETLRKGTPYQWVPNDDNYLFSDLSRSSTLLSLYGVLRDSQHKPYGMARVSIDYSYWFKSILNTSSGGQEYFLITGEGEDVAQGVSGDSLSLEVSDEIVSGGKQEGYLIDPVSEALINFSYIESLDWYIVNRIPSAILFDDLYSLKQQYFLTFFLFIAAFILIAFMIAYGFTRPLSHMQNKMREAVRKDLNIRLPEKRYKGEVFELAQTFNTMLADMNGLIRRLKTEEREKDAVHFQMLLAQLNPHFLLNTLNTMKWLALRNDQDEIAEMSMSLGKLLETSLNSDVDLIHLRDEMELIKAYIYIQQMRYNHRFTIHYEYEQANEYVLVPKLALQPLIENAIQHGIAHMTEGGSIRIRIYAEEEQSLIVEVEDNGVGVERASTMQPGRKRPGIGLKNIKERLRLLFKEKGSLEISSSESGTLVRLQFPYLLSRPFDQGQNASKDHGDL